MQKSCSSHGEYEDIYYGDANLYKHIMREYSKQPLNGSDEKKDFSDVNIPVRGYDIKSAPIIGIVDLTNRCNLSCNVCFAGCTSSPSLYEPSFSEIEQLMDTLRQSDPPCPIILFSGGEPTIRKDFFEICSLAHKKGFSFIIVATNGKLLAQDKSYHEKLNKAHVDIIYLQFDGLTEDPYMEIRGTNLLPMKLEAIENVRNSPAKYPAIVLVPTVIKGVNDHQISDIVKFAAKNITIIKGILFQPIGFVGDINNKKLLTGRITNSDCLEQMEKGFDGKISRYDFVPLVWLTDFLDAYKRMNPSSKTINIETHPGCFSVVYLVKKDDELIPLSRIINLEELRKFVRALNPANKAELITKFAFLLPKLILKEGIKLSGQLFEILKTLYFENAEEAIMNFHRENVLLVGFEHGIDVRNYDCDKVEKCCIHYATLDNESIPFCSYNLLHRKDIEERFSKE